MTFGEFNKEHYDNNDDHPQQQQQQPTQTKLPIRQHITQPRNPTSIDFYNPLPSNPNQPALLPIFARNENIQQQLYNPQPTQNNIYNEMYNPPPQQQIQYTEMYNQPQYLEMFNSSQQQRPLQYNLPQRPLQTQNIYNEMYKSPTIQNKTTPISYAISYDDDNNNIKENYNQSSPSPSNHNHITCIDVNDHITNCPICSNYYKNYTMIYLSIIALLIGVIILFLLKKIWEK